jgi:hypothetical protein
MSLSVNSEAFIVVKNNDESIPDAQLKIVAIYGYYPGHPYTDNAKYTIMGPYKFHGRNSGIHIVPQQEKMDVIYDGDFNISTIPLSFS